MTPNQQIALINKLTALADDEIILAHRDAEWTGHAPILEEDIALANIAQDEIGHATIYYQLRGDLDDSDPDELVYFRDPSDFRNTQLVELPKGDWAFTMLRQYLYDAYEYVLLNHLRQSSYQPLAEAVAKIHKEEIYHLRHTHIWVERLGLGTDESHRRMQAALDELWPYTAQLFQPLPDEHSLIEAEVVPQPAGFHTQWHNIVLPHLANANLTPPDTPPITASRTNHTDHLTDLLADLQMVARAHPTATW